MIEKRRNKKKKILRKKLKKKLLKLQNNYLESSSKKITEKVLSLQSFIDAKNIFIYESINREVSTKKIIEECQGLSKNIYVPKVLRNGIMQPVLLLDRNKVIKKEKIDLIIAPCIGTDIRGARLGYGGGYYDRFLSDFKGDVICLCYKKMRILYIPKNKYDIVIKEIITE